MDISWLPAQLFQNLCFQGSSSEPSSNVHRSLLSCAFPQPACNARRNSSPITQLRLAAIESSPSDFTCRPSVPATFARHGRSTKQEQSNITKRSKSLFEARDNREEQLIITSGNVRTWVHRVHPSTPSHHYCKPPRRGSGFENIPSSWAGHVGQFQLGAESSQISVYPQICH